MTSTMKKERKKFHFKRTRLTLLTKLMTSTSYEINYNFFYFFCMCTCYWMVDFWFYFRKPLVSIANKRNYRKVKKLTRNNKKMTLQNVFHKLR